MASNRKSKYHESPHKYKRKRIGKDKDYIVYACVLPNCNHYITPELLEGKEFLCWRCGKANLAGVLTRNLAKPHCKACTKSKKEETLIKTEPKSHTKNVGHLPIIVLDDLI